MAKGSKGGKKKKKSPGKTEQERGRKKAKKGASAPRSRKPKVRDSASLLTRLPSWYPLPFFILIGLFFRLSVTLWEPLAYIDSVQYLHLAHEIQSGVFFEKDFDLDQGFLKSRRLPPLYPFLLAPFANTGLDLEYAGISISLLMSLLSFIPLYLVTANIFSRRAAIISSALFSFHTFTLIYSSPILTEATFTALYISVIAISTYCLVRPSLWLFVVSGVLSSILYMTRDVGITAAFLIALGALVKLGLIDRIPWPRLIGFITALVISFLVVSAPYFIHIRVRTGHWGLTGQMSNTSITNQIQLFGGDAFDRDRLETDKKGTKLLGDKPARGVWDLVKLSPALLVKLVKNTGSYGLELVQRWGTFIFPLIIIGIMGIFRDYFTKRDRARLFMEVWVVVWIVQLWVLYSLITPYMVDDRYIYPLMLPGLILAGHGISMVTSWLTSRLQDKAKTESKTSISIQALLFPAALLLYLAVFPSCMEPRALKYYGLLNPSIPLYIFPLAGLTVLFGLAMIPGILLAVSSSLSTETSSFSETAIVFGLLLLGLVALWVPDLGPPLMKYFPGLILMGGGLALATRLTLMRGLVKAESFPFILSTFLVAVTFFAQWPDFVEIKTTRMSEWGITKKFPTGQKEAASEIQARGLVPPGKVICSRKHYMAYYLDGKPYLIPQTNKELAQLIRSGSIDYLVADSQNFKTLRPKLTEVAYRLKPLPGASIIYSKFSPKFKKIITVYDCHRPEPPLPDRGSAKAHILVGIDLFKARALPFAYREATRALELDPKNPEALDLQLKILQNYYILSNKSKIPTKNIAPNVQSSMKRVAGELVRLDPENAKSKKIIQDLKNFNKREQKIIQNYKRKKEGG